MERKEGKRKEGKEKKKIRGGNEKKRKMKKK